MSILAKDKLIKNNKWDLIKLTKLAKDKLINKDKWDKQHSKTNNWDEIIYYAYAMSALNISN